MPVDRVPDVVVVGAAILDGARVLAAQRAEPPRLAGYWEFPGGKVEPDDADDRAALARECREELGVEIAVGARLGGDVPLPGGTAVLRVFAARVVTGTPTPLEHLDLRWLAVGEVDDVAWLPTNAPLLPALRALLAAAGGAG